MKQKNVLYLFLLLMLCVAFVSCQGQAEVTADVGVTSAETSNFAESTVNETVEYAAVSLLTDNNYATSVEDFYASDITYKADLTHDGVEDICTIKVVGHGTECYEEELTITDGKSGEVIEVFSPVAYAHENIKFEQQETAYHIQTNGKVYEMKKETLDTPPEHLCDIGYGNIIDYTVKDGKLLCRMGIMCGIVEVCGEIVYEYSYRDGEMVVTSIKLSDFNAETQADFGVVEPLQLPIATEAEKANHDLGAIGGSENPYRDKYVAAMSGFLVVDGTFTKVTTYYDEAEQKEFYNVLYGYDEKKANIPLMVHLIREMSIPKDAYVAYLDAICAVYTSEQIDIIYSDNDKLINKTFHSPLALYHEGKIYTVYELIEIDAVDELFVSQLSQESLLALINGIYQYSDENDTEIPPEISAFLSKYVKQPLIQPIEDVRDEIPTTTYENPHAPDAVYYTDITGDGVDDICTVHVDWYGAMSYGESVTVTDGKSGKNIPIVTPKDFTNANIEFCVQSDYSIVCANGMEYKFERIIFEAISSYLGGMVDFTVADGKLICSVTLEFEFANGELEYDYSYVDGKLVVTGIKLYDYNKDVRADFGKIEPKSLYIPDEIVELLDMSVAEISERYGDMTIEYSEREGPFQPVYSVEGLDGIFLVYHNWDMNTPITDDMHAHEIIVTAADIGKIMGLRVGMNIEELPWRIVWEKAENRLVDGGFMLSSTFGEYTVTVGMGVEDVKEDIDDPDFWAKNAEKRRIDPQGEINYLRVSKTLKEEYEKVN